jgi:hypothetical protein
MSHATFAGMGRQSASAANKRRGLRRDLWTNVFREIHSLYSDQWEQSETSIIRDMCEQDFGLPMGYGRVGRAPQHLEWPLAVGFDDSYHQPMPDEVVHVTVVDGTTADQHPEIAPDEADRWIRGDFADGTWEDAPDALIVKPGQKVVVTR